MLIYGLPSSHDPLAPQYIPRRRPRPLRVVAAVPWLLALSLGACDAEGPTAPELTGAEGPTTDDPVTPDGVARPLLVEAESGTPGADVLVVTDATDASITYVTAAVNVTTAPVDLTDARIVTIPVQFRAPGTYQMYARVRIGPAGGNDDSFFIDTGTDMPTWSTLNGLTGFAVAGQPGYQQGAVIGDFGGQSTPGRWMWVLLENAVYTVTNVTTPRDFVYATREDALDIDKFAFALVGDGYTTGFTTDQLDDREPGVIVYPPVLPPPYEPPATQQPLAAGADKWLGMVCCGNQLPFLPNYFNQVTPENGGKWGSVEATRGTYNWAGVDEALAIAQNNGFPFRFHVLLWGSQQPDWIETLPPEEQLVAIRQWMEAVNERYAGMLDYIEVVNEFENQPPTEANEGNYVDALGGTGVTGYDWVLNAFRMAREVFGPEARLLLNEYSVLNTDDRTGRYVELINLLRAETLIDGAGVQGHAFSTTGPVAQMEMNLARLSAPGTPIFVTEMDVDGPELVQLTNFQRIFPLFWESDAIDGITLWGYRDGMWREQQQATLVYPNGAEKPALRWLKGYLRGTAPVVGGPATVAVAAGYEPGTEVAALTATPPGGGAYPEGTVVSWRVVPALGMVSDGSQAVAFEEGTGRLVLDGATLTAGTYAVRVFADVDATVSNIFDIALTIQ